ncbi:MAG: hypothetical protein Q9173_000337 [Seirophora scorigena]
MAQVQIKSAVKRKLNQSVSNTASKTAIQFDVQQSLGLAQRQSFTFVHTLLHSSLAQLAYLRHLFPDDCFEDKSFDAICEDAGTLYRNDGGTVYTRKRQKVRGEAADRSASPSNLKVLIPNSRPGVNVFLGWLDGILQAVRKGTLTKAQFCICPDPMDRTNIIESYTLRFYYGTENPQSPRQSVGLAVSGTGSGPVPITGLKKSVVDLLALVASLTAKMPDLPVEDSSEWRPKTVEVGYVDSGQHRYVRTRLDGTECITYGFRVSLDITHMQRVGEEDAQSDHLYTIPDKMLHNRVLSRITGSPQANLVSSSPPQALLQGCPDPPVPTQEVAASGQAETPGKSLKDRQLMTNLVQRLKSEGFLKPARGGKLVRIDTAEQIDRRQQSYCDPMTLVSHCLRPSSGLMEYRISRAYTTVLDHRNFIEMSDQRLSAELQPPWGYRERAAPPLTKGRKRGDDGVAAFMQHVPASSAFTVRSNRRQSCLAAKAIGLESGEDIEIKRLYRKV